MTIARGGLFRVLHVTWIFAVLVSSQEQSCPSSTVLGTDGGFDVGGREPLCYVSRINATLTEIQQGGDGGVLFSQNTFNLINQDLYKGGKGSRNNLILLSHCFNQTELNVTNLDQFDRSPTTQQYTMEKGETFRFRISIVSNLSTVNPNINFTALNGNLTIHTRLNFCDALSLGYCNPLDDTTDLDATVTPEDTDVGALPGQQFPPGDDRWMYDPNVTLKGLILDGGSRIVTRWVRWKMKETTTKSPLYNTSVDVTLVLPPEARSGAFFVLGHVVMNFDVGSFIERIDIADAVLTNAVYVADQPQIKDVSKGMIIYISITIGVVALLQIVAMTYMLLNMRHPAMKLAQGYFLLSMVAAGMLQTTFSFTFLPLYDWLCAARGLAVILPMHVGGCIVVARIWRVHMTLSAAMMMGRSSSANRAGVGGYDIGYHYTRFLQMIASLPLLLCFCSRREPPSKKGGFRQTIPAREAASLVVMLSLPQIGLQLFGLIYYGGHLTEQLDPTDTVGRLVCECNSSWVLSVGISLVGLVYISAVYIAWLARNLPSAFNEKDQVFQCAGISAILSFVSVFLTALIAADPGGDPDILIFCYTIPPLGISVTLLWVLIMPKLRRVASGEKVVVSALLESRYSSTTSSSSSHPMSLDTPIPPSEIIVIKLGDGLPQSLELEILRVSDMLQTVQALSADGRPLSKEEWTDLKASSQALNAHLSQLRFEWSASEAAPSMDLKNVITLTA